MGLEYRGGHGPYYYRKRRRGGRVVGVYLGRGPLARELALMDADDRAERAEYRRLQAEARAEAEAIECELGRIAGAALALGRAALIDAGYSQHDRGQWRRRRVRPQSG